MLGHLVSFRLVLSVSIVASLSATIFQNCLVEAADGFAKTVARSNELGDPSHIEDASSKAVEGSGKAVEGSGKAVEGAGKAAEGAGEAAEGSGKAAEGSGKAVEGSGKSAEGSGKEAAGKAVEGSGKAVEGSGKAVEGSGKAADGSSKESDGSNKAADGSAKSVEGSGKAADGSSKVADESIKTLDAGNETTSESSESEPMQTTDTEPAHSVEHANNASSEDTDSDEYKVSADDLPGALKAGTIQFKRRDFKACIHICDEIIKFNKDYMPAFALRGRALVASKKYQEATEDLNKVITANAANHTIFGARAIALLQTENLKQVIEDSSRAISENPKNQEYYIVRAIAEHRSKDNKHAMDDISKGISLDPEGPNLPLFLLARADIYTELGKDDDCLKDLNKIIKLRPRDPQSYMNRANFYMKKSDWEKVVQDLDSVIDFALMGPLSNQALIMRAEAYRKISNYADAETDYSSLLAGYPKDVDYLYGRAEARYKLQKFEKALKDINLAIELNQMQARLFELRALIYDALKMSDKAEIDRQKARELSTKNS